MRSARIAVLFAAASPLVGCDAIGACGEFVGTWSAQGAYGGTQNAAIVKDGSMFRVEFAGSMYNTTLPATCEDGTLRTGSWLGDIGYSETTNSIVTSLGSLGRAD